MTEQTTPREAWWTRELRKRRGRIKRQRGIIERLVAALIKHKVPEEDWRFDNSSDEEFDRGFYASNVFQAAQKNLQGTTINEFLLTQKQDEKH
jgi:hypothetical protein